MTITEYPSAQQYLGRRFAPDEPLQVTQGIVDYLINKRRTQTGRQAVIAVLQQMKEQGKIYGNFVLPDPSEV